ncbi:hypothetical protein B0T18DRAFT_17202 [Schizothecium vesticola]|uniref:Uncharacterized protein n=1 Tax=Schizothecium vesticola TaxID=314040 RepID=A0AA40KC94_9PEZI|nr:hypothetical protein B0T18DRAFT_17202 [Schizothecium vesticola]
MTLVRRDSRYRPTPQSRPTLPPNMSRQPNFSSIIHLRDFIDIVADDPSRDAPNFVEIQTGINVFKDGSSSPNISVEPVRVRIHAYPTREKRDAYALNAFFYVDSRFSAAPSEDGNSGDQHPDPEPYEVCRYRLFMT